MSVVSVDMFNMVHTAKRNVPLKLTPCTSALFRDVIRVTPTAIALVVPTVSLAVLVKRTDWVLVVVMPVILWFMNLAIHTAARRALVADVHRISTQSPSMQEATGLVTATQ